MKQVSKFMLLFLMIVLLTALIFPGAVSAEMDSLDQVAEDIDEAPGYEDSMDAEREWAFSLGIIAGLSPDYEGSDDYELGIAPNFSFSWRNIIFYKGRSLGANLIRKKSFKAGPILSWNSGRDEGDNDRLEGLGDIDSTIEAGGFIYYRNKPLRFRLEVRQDVNSGHEGVLVELNGGATLPFKNPLVFIVLGTTWASDDYMESFFGVDAKQSGDSALKTYKAEAGIKDINIGLTTGYSMTNRWRVGGKIEYKRLMNDAANSPIVDDKNQFLAGISLSYHMGSKILPEDLQ